MTTIDIATHPGLRFSVGLDIGGTSTRAVLLADDDTVVAFRSVPTERGPVGVVRSAAAAVRSVLSDAGIDDRSIDQIGVGIPGAVDPDRGVVREAVNLDIDATGFDLRAALGEHFACPIHIENDVKAAAIGAEHMIAAACGRSPDLAYLSIGTGIAAGFVVGGVLRHGASLVAGEIGHIPIDPSGPLCACGQVGCIEAIASGTAIDKLWPSAAGSSAASLAAAAAAGDPAAVSVWSSVIGGLARAVLMLALTIDPEVIVLGGGVAELGQPLCDAIIARLAAEQTSSEFLRSLDLGSRLRLLDPALPVGAIGAVRAARHVMIAG